MVPPPPAGYPAPPPRSSTTPLLIALAAGMALVVLLVAGVIGYLLLRDDEDAEAGTGPVTLREPLGFHQVAEIGQAPCAQGMLADIDGDSCYRLQPGGMTVRSVEDMRALGPQPDQGQPSWRVGIRLTPADAPLFERLSQRAGAQSTGTPGNQIAIVAGQKVLSAPAIASGPITGGRLEITGAQATFTQRYVNDLVRRMAGRTRS